MKNFRVAVAVDADWRVCTAACAARLGGDHGAAIGLLYVSDAFADHVPAIRSRLREATGVADWSGSVGMGVLAGTTELNDQPALVAAIAPMPVGSYRLVGGASAATTEGGAYPFGLVHLDPRREDSIGQLASLASRSGAFLVGGLASSRRPVASAKAPSAPGSLDGILFDARVGVQTGLTQGCTPLGPAHLITEGREHIVATLDGRPALEALREDAGGLPDDLRRLGDWLHVGLPLPHSDRRDYVVRDVIGIDPMRGWIAIAESVAPGDRLMFVRRDAESARADLLAMCRSLAARLGGAPRGGVYFSCVARGRHMFGSDGAELAVINAELGGMPLIGFACGGEINNARIYGYTGVLCVFT
jgi:small ligand-binding sensory domain FIST